MRLIEDTRTKDGARSRLAVDQHQHAPSTAFMSTCRRGPRRRRAATPKANYVHLHCAPCMEGRPSVHPDVFPTFNPWVGVEREGEKKAKPAATRPEAYALAGALKAMGEPHLGAAALICFEWHQRPEHVVGLGALTWAAWRPVDHPRPGKASQNGRHGVVAL